VNPGDANLVRSGFENHFTRSLDEAVGSAEIVVLCAAHAAYRDLPAALLAQRGGGKQLFDGCGLTGPRGAKSGPMSVPGLGKGRGAPSPALLDFVEAGFRAVELGVANETAALMEFLNARYSLDGYNRADFRDVQRLAATCVTGCRIVDPGPVAELPRFDGFAFRLAGRARAAFVRKADGRRT
jgi:hypothetical protein